MNPSVEWAISTLNSLSQMGYTGKIQLNFNLGSITGVNLEQSLKPMMEIRIVPMGREVVMNKI